MKAFFTANYGGEYKTPSGTSYNIWRCCDIHGACIAFIIKHETSKHFVLHMYGDIMMMTQQKFDSLEETMQYMDAALIELGYKHLPDHYKTLL